jgi:thiaminase (transcriptional activator TenA)
MKRGKSLAETLWEANADLTRTALEHRFVRGLADGSLPVESFQSYVAQDAFFLESFARAYALALAHSDDQRGLRDFAELISGVIEELELHEGYAGRWGVSLKGVEPGEATLAYTDFLLATASLSGVGETCAAMTPCMRLYAFLGRSLAGEGYDESNPYSEWIRTYADPEFEVLAAKLEVLLNRYAADTPAVRSAYRRAMALEVAFFEANAGADNNEGLTS